MPGPFQALQPPQARLFQPSVFKPNPFQPVPQLTGLSVTMAGNPNAPAPPQPSATGQPQEATCACWVAPTFSGASGAVLFTYLPHVAAGVIYYVHSMTSKGYG